jgi:hypothetical protein
MVEELFISLTSLSDLLYLYIQLLIIITAIDIFAVIAGAILKVFKA